MKPREGTKKMLCGTWYRRSDQRYLYGSGRRLDDDHLRLADEESTTPRQDHEDIAQTDDRYIYHDADVYRCPDDHRMNEWMKHHRQDERTSECDHWSPLSSLCGRDRFLDPVYRYAFVSRDRDDYISYKVCKVIKFIK